MNSWIIENDLIKIWWEEGVLCCSYETSFVDLEIAKKMVDFRLEVINNKACPLFADIRKLKILDKEARHYLAHQDGAKLVTACALLIESEISKIIGNFFLNVNKPINPIKIFTKKDEAMKWLKNFREVE